MRVRLSFASPRTLAIAVMLAVIAQLALPLLADAHANTANTGNMNGYQQTNLVSNIPGLARVTDPNLVNPWGISHSATSPFWVSDNGAGVATLYNGSGTPFPPGSPLIVQIPPPQGSPAGTAATPTGNLFNAVLATNPSDFVVSENGVSGPSFFIFATEDGTISGWNPTVDLTHAILEVDNSASAVYKGLAQGSVGANNYLYAANFHDGTVDVFDRTFHQVTLAGSFSDPNLPAGYAPFGITNIGGKIYVSYALQNAEKHDDVRGRGHGFIDVFNTNGTLVKRFASRGALNSPWGMVRAPNSFGDFSGDLLIGNFGNGHINAFDPQSGEFLGPLRNRNDTPITINGLWGLIFGNGGNAGPTNTLFFTAGINDEADGLFGSIRSVEGQ